MREKRLLISKWKILMMIKSKRLVLLALATVGLQGCSKNYEHVVTDNYPGPELEASFYQVPDTEINSAGWLTKGEVDIYGETFEFQFDAFDKCPASMKIKVAEPMFSPGRVLSYVLNEADKKKYSKPLTDECVMALVVKIVNSLPEETLNAESYK